MQNISNEQSLSVKNLDKLPMFNPLSYEQYFPVNTVFQQSLFFQAQNSLQPFRNSPPCKSRNTKVLNDYILTTAETHNLFEYN